ncbi:transcription antitermination factor NusB [uncultured Megasphaera sp.]|uniref:transcription antitermination factor NusB n=1 Tax=uncultured Megasphaera sp. TaxID=165188 RepID=UPI003783E69D
MSRHRARQKALEILFSREFHGKDDIQYQEDEILNSVNGADDEDTPVVQDEENYCDYLVTTTTEHMNEFDQIIQSLAKGWDVSQMNRADKNVMRMALCELLYPKDVDMADAVILNEAIELAKEFSGHKSSRFVNGILGTYVRQRK